jgi:non-heme chloroperoxidase
LKADARDTQMMFLAERGCRLIAHKRCGHGRSGQPLTPHDVCVMHADRLKANLLEFLQS